MDRTSGKEVGGPYATRQDAERAMGSFDQSPAELDVVSENEESDEDEGDSTSKEGAKHASGPEGSQFDAGGTPETEGDTGPSDPGVEPHGQAEPQTQVAPVSTKPSQMPSGGGDGGMDPGMSMGIPTMPGSPQFDPASMSTDPIGQGINAVAELIAAENPELDAETTRKVARKVVGRLVTAEDWGWGAHMPHIEDPLAHHHPLYFLMHERNRRLEERRKREQAGEGENRPHQEDVIPGGHHRYDPSKDIGEEFEESSSSLPHGGLSEEEMPDLSEFDRKPERPNYWWMKESSSSLPTVAAWGWEPTMSEDIEDPLAQKAPKSDQGKDDESKSDSGGGSSLPHIPGAGNLLGGGGGGAEAGGAAAGGEAGGAAALAEEALPLLLV